MADRQTDYVSIIVGEKLGGMSPISSKCSIFKVPNQLRQINDKAYEPKAVAIGPYHYGKDLHMIKQLKLLYLQKFLQRKKKDVARYVRSMRKRVENARNCYEQPISLGTDKFVEMMLFDACFIVELVRKYQNLKNQNEGLRDDENDPIFQMSWLFSSVQRDLLLVENQIPFFVLKKLFHKTEMSNQQENFTEMVLQFFGLDSVRKYKLPQDIKHILSLLHYISYKPCSQPSVAENDQLPPECSSSQHINCPISCFQSSVAENDQPPPEYSHDILFQETETEIKFISSATELHEAGIEFQKSKAITSSYVKFENGKLEIPELRIEDDTESRFRNFIAYEQHHNYGTKHVTNYMNFMDCIINSPKDVELLRDKGIIDNWLGDDEVVASMFNKLGDSIIIFQDDSYAKVFKDVNDHCSKPCKKWMANLRHKYFNSPWAFISLVAASLLLLMTFVQTLFSVLAYFQ